MYQGTAEYEYLALVINYNDFLNKTILKKEYFTKKNAIMFDILIKEYNKNKALNITQLVSYNNFDINHYMELLNSNMYHSSKETQFKILEKQVIDDFKNRKIKEIIKAYNNNQEEFYKQVDKIKSINIEENEYITSDDILNSLGDEQKPIKLGFSDVDNYLHIAQNDFVVLAGGTGTGKTTFALNILSNLSKEYQCVYFNMEMSKKTLYKRLCSIETGIDITKLNNIKSLEQSQVHMLYQKVGSIEERKIILINKSQNIDEIEKTISRIKDNRKLVVILDHIGLISGGAGSLYEKMTNIAKKIRGLCLDYDCTIFGLCQLSRESQKEERPPKLQDLRDSGEIEQSARKVILLYNKDVKNQNQIKDVELMIAKNDDGGNVIKSFKFDVKRQKFMEVENGK